MYTPFSKRFYDVGTEDLAILREVAEGWYVEYKSLPPSNKAIAKSLSAFANHYGGWLFIGVAEASDGSRLAGAFRGVPTRNVPEIEVTIRDAARHHVHPTPYYEVRILDGPDDSIGLVPENSIVAVRVPTGPNPPYVHSSGRIYRRIADSSEPCPETDRSILDLLWRRGRDSRRKLARRLRRIPTVSKFEEGRTFLHLHLIPDPMGQRGFRHGLRFDEFVKLATRIETTDDGGEAYAPDVTFDNVYSSSDGFVARHISTNEPDLTVLTWRFRRDGSSTFTAPLNRYDNSSGESVARSGHRCLVDLIEFMDTSGHGETSVLDMSQVFPLLASAIRKQRHALRVCGLEDTEFFAKGYLENIWRKTPFIDTMGYLEFVRQHGVPYPQDKSAFFPSGTGHDSLVRLSPPGSPDNDARDEGSNAYIMFRLAMEALGLPFDSLQAASLVKEILDSAAERCRHLNSKLPLDLLARYQPSLGPDTTESHL